MQLKGNLIGEQTHLGWGRHQLPSLLTAALLTGWLAGGATLARADEWELGDVVVGNVRKVLSGGTVSVEGDYTILSNAGVARESINSGLEGAVTGCAFNPELDQLYTTNFNNTRVVVFEDAHSHGVTQTIDTNATSPDGHSESIVFAANGDFYVGHADGNQDIHRYNAAGIFQQAYDVAVEDRGSDWVELAVDQRTLFYTSEGRQIKRYDVLSDTQLADFALLPGPGFPDNAAFALRLLPPGDGSGGLLVADASNIKRLDATGAVVWTYDAPDEDTWFALNLDPNGTSFWAGTFVAEFVVGSGSLYKFNIETGDIELSVPSGVVRTGDVGGVCLRGEPTAALTPPNEIALDPATAENPAGTSHTVTASVAAMGAPVAGLEVGFEVVSGPNTGEMSDFGECSVNPDCTTDAAGQVSWSYSDSGVPGTDSIEACVADRAGRETCAEATKDWLNTPPVAGCTESVNPSGKKTPPAGRTTLPGPKGGQNEDGFYALIGEDAEDGTADVFVTNATGSVIFGPFASGSVVKVTEASEEMPTSKPIGGPNSALAAHIILDSDALVFAVDSFGAVSETVSCLVPPLPK